MDLFHDVFKSFILQGAEKLDIDIEEALISGGERSLLKDHFSEGLEGLHSSGIWNSVIFEGLS